MDATNSSASLRKRLPLTLFLTLVLVLSAVTVMLALAPSDFDAADGNLIIDPLRRWETQPGLNLTPG